jgi:mediator of RNA polymerase II transcription subunit 31
MKQRDNGEKEEKGRTNRMRANDQFLQCLANPLYLSELGAQGYFDKPEFLNYLKYLEYWRQDGYVQYIRYAVSVPFIHFLMCKITR